MANTSGPLSQLKNPWAGDWFSFNSGTTMSIIPIDQLTSTTQSTAFVMKKDQKIHEREDVKPDAGEHKYGDVEFADPTNNKYPIDTPDHIRAAWSYINHDQNAAKYSGDEVEQIKNRIRKAAKKHDVTIKAD